MRGRGEERGWRKGREGGGEKIEGRVEEGEGGKRRGRKGGERRGGGRRRSVKKGEGGGGLGKKGEGDCVELHCTMSFIMQGWYLYLVTSRWFGLRLDLISALYLGVVAFISIPLARSKLT